MAFTAVENSITCGAEKSCYTGGSGATAQTSDAIVQLFADLNAMATGNEVCIKFYEKVMAGGTQRIVDQWTFVGVQSRPIFVSPAFCVHVGWDFTITGVSGTPVVPCSIRPVALV